MRFSTERLILRTLTAQDSAAILNIRSNVEINRFLQRNPPKNTFEALDFILGIQKRSVQQEIVFFGISLSADPTLIGTICLWKFSEDRKTAELGYELLPEYQGQGIMSEAIDSVLKYGFESLELKSIEAFTNKNNLNSIRLLEKFKFIIQNNRRDDKYPENLIFELNND